MVVEHETTLRMWQSHNFVDEEQNIRCENIEVALLEAGISGKDRRIDKILTAEVVLGSNEGREEFLVKT